jgi:hypothetical protein
MTGSGHAFTRMGMSFHGIGGCRVTTMCRAVRLSYHQPLVAAPPNAAGGFPHERAHTIRRNPAAAALASRSLFNGTRKPLKWSMDCVGR